LDAFEHFAAERTLVNQLSTMLKAPTADIPARVEQTLQKLRQMEKQLAELRSQQMLARPGKLVEQATTDGEGTSFADNVDEVSTADALRATAQELRDRVTKAVNQKIVVAKIGNENNRPIVVTRANDGAQNLGHKAGNLVKAASQ